MRALILHCAGAIVLFACSLVVEPSPFAQGLSLSEKAQSSIVYIYFDVTDDKTGAKSKVQGTGFIVSKTGYVLTASHLFRDWRKQSNVEKIKNEIKGTLRDKPGFVTESPLVLQIINSGDADAEDVALLKLPRLQQDYSSAPICLDTSSPKVGDTFTAFGFPQDQNFQPVRGSLGTQHAAGGRWAAEAAFTYGMSGGPTYNTRGHVIGLIKGGLPNTEAVRWITPIQHAANILRQAGFSDDCKSSPDIKTALVGKYQVVLGPGGGCGGGAPNSRPKQPAFIDNNNGSLIATNECGNTSPVEVVDGRHGVWWNQIIDFIVDDRNITITITERRSGGNSWEKIK